MSAEAEVLISSLLLQIETALQCRSLSDIASHKLTTLRRLHIMPNIQDGGQ